MILAKVIGQVIATQKDSSHEGKKILLVQGLSLRNEPMGDPFVALDDRFYTSRDAARDHWERTADEYAATA